MDQRLPIDRKKGFVRCKQTLAKKLWRPLQHGTEAAHVKRRRAVGIGRSRAGLPEVVHSPHDKLREIVVPEEHHTLVEKHFGTDAWANQGETHRFFSFFTASSKNVQITAEQKSHSAQQHARRRQEPSDNASICIAHSSFTFLTVSSMAHGNIPLLANSCFDIG